MPHIEDEITISVQMHMEYFQASEYAYFYI